MRRIFYSLLFLLLSIAGNTQKDSMDAIFTFRISDYMVKLDDSTTVVQVAIPDSWPLRISEKQMGVLKYRFEPGKDYDTAMIGYGRCYLIKGEWHYFTIKRTKDRGPQQGDLLITKCKIPKAYTGLLFNLARNGISLTNVYDEPFYNSTEIFSFGPATEQAFLDSMAADIRYTAKAMLKQGSIPNQVVNGGIYDGKKVFDAMQAITKKDVEKFLKYVKVSPSKYAGNTWKVSEVFATWMVSKTPEAIE
ncbi:MAG: hypothetical protein E6H07_14515 [Bacteroidetes bacterium]|nr:MAG: hypothetical protein E6H07_14515 [Bacteroidota bacterium]